MKYLRLALLLVCSPPLLAQDAKSALDDWQQACKVIVAAPVNEPQFTGPLGASQLPQCNSEALYYGFDSKPDYAAALQCAWYERAHANPTRGDMFPGVGVLTMLYANGRGTAQDIDLAKHFACEQQWAAPAEMSGRLRHLDAMGNGAAPATPFDLCDDGTSGLTMGACAYVQTRFAGAERDQKLAKIIAGLSPAQRQLYDKLRAAEQAFADVRSGNEVDMTGTGRSAFALEDSRKIDDQLLINLQRFSAGDIPVATAADANSLDAQMNALYQKILQMPEEPMGLGYSTVKPSGIRETQRTWLKLRDAWLEFSRAAYPRLSADRVRAQLIRLRLNQLRRLPIDLK